jgi:hypothetical protein
MRTVREIESAEFEKALRLLGTPGWRTVRCSLCARKMVWSAEWDEESGDLLDKYAVCEVCLFYL